MQKLIVTSATYRQSSKVTPELLQRDPENRLLARGPRFRLPAEMIRDQALLVAGLLVEKLGGPSVKPYQPEGLWKELAMQDMDYVAEQGRGSLSPQPVHLLEAHRRAADDGELRCGRSRKLRGARDPHEHAAAGAEPDERRDVRRGRALPRPAHDEGRRRDPDARLRYGFRLALGRAPSDAERQILREQPALITCDYFAAQRRPSRRIPEPGRVAAGSHRSTDANWPPTRR